MKGSILFLFLLSLNVSAQSTNTGNGPGNGHVEDRIVISCFPIVQGHSSTGQVSTIGPAITRDFDRSKLNSDSILQMSASYADTTIKLSIDSTSLNLSSPGDEPIEGKVDYQHGFDLSITDNLTGNALEEHFAYYTFGNMEFKNEISSSMVQELELASGLVLQQAGSLRLGKSRPAHDINNESIIIDSLHVQCFVQ